MTQFRNQFGIFCCFLISFSIRFQFEIFCLRVPNTLDGGAGGLGLFTVAGWTERGRDRGREREGGVCIHYVYAALRPKSNEKAATITEYKTRAKQNSETEQQQLQQQ